MTIQTLQSRLADKNLYVGAIDGDPGPGTIAGAMAFASMKAISPDITALSAPLSTVMKAREIDTVLRIAHFLGTLAIESAGFTRMEENLHYTTAARLMAVFPREIDSADRATKLIVGGPEAIANHVYANRNGNGDEASGDGWRFRGRTPAQVTGRTNYAVMSHLIDIDIEADPDQAIKPHVGALVCGAFWAQHDLNRFADANDAPTIRLRWNGPAKEGLAEVRVIVERILALAA